MADQAHKKTAQQTIQTLNFAQGSYLESTSRPLYALMFLLPMVVCYELGTILVNTDQIAHTQARVAAFTWLVGLAEWIGVDQSIAWAFPGFVVTIILLCWHMSSQHSWRVRMSRLGWMAVECIILTLPLFIMGAIVNSSHDFAVCVGHPAGVAGPLAGRSSFWANIVTSIGAGIYEELVFRLILMGLLIMLMEDILRIKGSAVTIVAVMISAGLFAAHHYVGLEHGTIARLKEEPFTLSSFVFRALAGVYFAVLFRYRGYGITAGTHAVYNMIYFSFS